MANPDTEPPLDRLGAAISGFQADDPFAPVTVVVPSAFARVQLRRAVASRTGICNVQFRTWGELTNDLGRSDDGPTARIPAPRVVNEALRQVLMAHPSPFSSFARMPQARAELVGLLNELWRAGPDLLTRLAGHGGRAASLVVTLEAVETHLSDHDFTNPSRVLDLAAVASIDRDSLGAIVLWYPRPNRGRDRAVLEHLRSSGVPITTIEAETDWEAAISFVVECSDPDEEVRVIARELIAAVEAGVPLWRQAIIHPPLDRYRRTVHQQLAVSGIATSGPSPMTLAQSATGRALAGLLELAERTWRRADVMRWLATAPITTGADGPRVPVNRWDDVSARAGVVEGLDQWRTRLARFAEGGTARDLHVAHSDGESGSARALEQFVNRLDEELNPGATRWSEWASWARRLLDLHLDPDDRTEPWPATEVKAAQAVRDVLHELGGLDEVASAADLAAFSSAVVDELATHPVRDDSGVALPGSEDEPDLPEVGDRVGLPGPVGSGLFVGSPSQTRGLNFDRVYIVGLADQFLPGSQSRRSLITEPDLDDADWPTPARRAAEMLDDVRAVVALTDDRVVASWPRIDPRNGREQGRSRWLDATGALGGEQRTQTVPSFHADMAGMGAAAVPVSRSDRLLGDLTRSVALGVPIEHHPDVKGAGGLVPLGHGVAAARAPLMPGFSRFEGRVGMGLAGGIAEELSPTRLEEYASCPRRYLLSRELRLKIPFRPELTEQMEPRDRGTLIHEILADYVGERLTEGTPADLDRLLEIAAVKFSIAKAEGRCGPPLMAEVEEANLIREVRRFFEEDTLEPRAVELVFGVKAVADDVPDDRGGASVDAVAERTAAVEVELNDGRILRFGGAVDRIDIGPADSLLVSDYKTGRQATLGELVKDPVGAGTKLQLPIYALAAKAFLNWDGRVQARYWLTSWNREQGSLLCDVDEPLLGRLREVLSQIVDGIDAGAFPGVPGPETYRYRRPTFDHCTHCDFNRLCPTDRDRRWSVVREAPEVASVNALGEPTDDSLRGVARVLPVDLTKRR